MSRMRLTSVSSEGGGEDFLFVMGGLEDFWFWGELKIASKALRSAGVMVERATRLGRGEIGVSE